jgi:hypothetical protein
MRRTKFCEKEEIGNLISSYGSLDSWNLTYQNLLRTEFCEKEEIGYLFSSYGSLDSFM